MENNKSTKGLNQIIVDPKGTTGDLSKLPKKAGFILRVFKPIIYGCLALMLAGLVGVFYGNKWTMNGLEILYVSEAELLELEKHRIKSQELENRQLFFGKPQEAIKLVEEISQRQRAQQIVVFSEKAVFGPRTRSISEEVHEEIVQILGNQ